MKDKYDDAIEYLSGFSDGYAFRSAIRCAWELPLHDRAGCLFGWCAHVDYEPDDLGEHCGCLTQVRLSKSKLGVNYVAQTPELTAAIRADDRLPGCVEDIELEHLPVFAEWQRRLDRELGR